MSLQQGLFKELAFTSRSPESSLMITDSFNFIRFHKNKPLHNIQDTAEGQSEGGSHGNAWLNHEIALSQVHKRTISSMINRCSSGKDWSFG